MIGLFRKEVLENRSVNKDSALAMRSVPVKVSLYMLFILICLAVFFIWLFGGTIYETVSLRGVASPNTSRGNIYAPTSGIITKAPVRIGDTVNEGDPLVYMPQEGPAESADDTGSGLSGNDKRSVIRSKISGTVTYILDSNSYVEPGEVVASVVEDDKNGNNDIIKAYIPDGISDLISVGMEAHIMPAYAPQEQYGYIYGFVSAISEYPLTGNQINNLNENLYLSGMDKQESYIELEITMIRSGERGGDFKWSKSSSIGKKVNPGTHCDIEIVMKKKKPFKWLLRI